VAWDAEEPVGGVGPGAPATLRTAALAEAEPSLRPVRELTWSDGGLHLRLTAQGPWSVDDLLALARSVQTTG
jgi:hypothetical protein